MEWQNIRRQTCFIKWSSRGMFQKNVDCSVAPRHLLRLQTRWNAVKWLRNAAECCTLIGQPCGMLTPQWWMNIVLNDSYFVCFAMLKLIWPMVWNGKMFMTNFYRLKLTDWRFPMLKANCVASCDTKSSLADVLLS